MLLIVAHKTIGSAYNLKDSFSGDAKGLQRLFPRLILPNHVLEKNRFRMIELQSCYVTVHVTGTSALDIANGTLKTAVCINQSSAESALNC